MKTEEGGYADKKSDKLRAMTLIISISNDELKIMK